jgi:peptide/nickel transport system ATP-binding protein
MPLLDVKDLKMYYKLSKGWVKAVDGVSFSLNRGETLGLVGESGCGKTSLMYTLLRLLPENARLVGGQMSFDGEELCSMAEDRLREIRWKRISMIFQNAMNALNPVFKVGDQIIEVLEVHEHLSRSDAKKRAAALFELVGLSPSYMNNYPHEFSGGMRQRAVIATSLACDPDLIIADEPVTALDVVVQDQILREIKDMQESKNIAMIVVSHDVSVIAETCEKVAVMYGGRIIEFGDSLSLFHNARHPYTIGLLSSFPTLHGPKRKLTSIEGAPPDLLNAPEGCLFVPRCPLAKSLCYSRPPKAVISAGHFSECHFATDSSLQNLRFAT